MRMSEGVITDPIAKKGYDKEMQDLVKKTRRIKKYSSSTRTTYDEDWGNLPKYDGVTWTPGNTSF